MKKILVSSIFACLVFSLSVFAQKGKPPSGCSFNIPANLVINPGTNISADGATPGGLYANGGRGSSKISVSLSEGSCSLGDFIVQLNNSTRYMVANIPGFGIFNAKFANFDRVGTVPITTDNTAMNTFCSAAPPANDNYGGCGVDSLGRRYVRRNVGFDLGNGINNLRFQESPLESPTPPVAGTAYIKVYHPNPNTWELLPENAGENGIGEVGAFLTNGARTGSPIVPFWFTVTRQ